MRLSLFSGFADRGNRVREVLLATLEHGNLSTKLFQLLGVLLLAIEKSLNMPALLLYSSLERLVPLL
jgi:hypothetical protein